VAARIKPFASVWDGKRYVLVDPTSENIVTPPDQPTIVGAEPMSFIQGNRTYGYDNIAPGSPKGVENVEPGAAPAPTPPAENNSVGNPETKNNEDIVPGTVEESGTEIP
jgi:hypothetical protein